MNEELLTVPEVLAELRVSRSTWFYWRQTGKGPRVIKLPNGQLRVRRSALGRWLGELEQDAA
ncbi:DNA-binding protein [Micromonospora musae]|uniref:Transcriptional regulator, AlpA family n=3 Tax=Micromonospora TaxID=1873 RepID=A0A1C3NAA3_9ACTN|nr:MULTISPECIES: helix-turn-helix domain-containing protein [Micromonospora]MBY8873997.1 helix-turn-helix domain-containing protein [Micromonospora sp. PLK6-60]RKN13293.1 DNA-binding protein [Micromonospora musae]SBV29524.1 transcriptional regulator, AlpA family [Micromonospora krabiensis]